MTDKDRREILESLKKIRLSAAMLEVGFGMDNISEIVQCQIELDALAARLQAEHGDLVTSSECDQAKGSLNAFVALVDEAMEKAKRSVEKK